MKKYLIELLFDISRLRKLKYPEEGIKEEHKSHPEGAAFDHGYNLGIEDAIKFFKGNESEWIDSPSNPNNK